MNIPVHATMLITLLIVSTFCNCYYFGIPFQLESTGLPSPSCPTHASSNTPGTRLLLGSYAERLRRDKS
jgi:hypothetical protein